MRPRGRTSRSEVDAAGRELLDEGLVGDVRLHVEVHPRVARVEVGHRPGPVDGLANPKTGRVVHLDRVDVVLDVAGAVVAAAASVVGHGALGRSFDSEAPLATHVLTRDGHRVGVVPGKSGAVLRGGALLGDRHAHGVRRLRENDPQEGDHQECEQPAEQAVVAESCDDGRVHEFSVLVVVHRVRMKTILLY